MLGKWEKVKSKMFWGPTTVWGGSGKTFMKYHGAE